VSLLLDEIALAAARLAEAGVESPRAEAELIAAHVHGVKRTELHQVPDAAFDARFWEAVARRAAREPLQHITGSAYFRYLELEVGPGVFVPRPETEVLTGWAIGLVVCGMIIRQGLGAESLAYSIMILVLPLCCVYYPVWALPLWLQPAAWSLTPTYVFEGMRAILIDGVFRADLMADALIINAVLLAASFAAFLALLRSARRHGALIQSGE